MEIEVKSLFEPSSENDGFRILVGAIWPRGLKRNETEIDLWAKELAPSSELRKWFNYDPNKWEEFVEDYTFQLNRNRKRMEQLISIVQHHPKVSLLYIPRQEPYNYALAMKYYLERHISDAPN
tara:strand:+ start:345 stop:713 length:369 start_codon:yes stop_codon:yes gene_type:complete